MADTTPNPEEFSKMQEEALERLREMQKRSRSMVAGTQPGDGMGAPQNAGMSGRGMSPNAGMSGRGMSLNAGMTGRGMSLNTSTSGSMSGGFPGGAAQSRGQPSDRPAGQALSGGSGMGLSVSSVSGIIKSLLGEAGKLDTDSLLILLMLFALYKNKADIKLLAAMGYILL